MAGLSNIFGGDNQSASSDGDLNASSVADAGNTVGLDFDSEQSAESVDEDGNSETSSNSSDLSLDSDTDGLLGNVTDAAGMTDEPSN